MSETLSGELKVNITPPGGSAEVAKTYRYANELVTGSMRRQFTVPANQTNYPLAIPLSTVSFLMMTGDGVFTYRLGSTGATPRTCRRVMMETPNAEAISNVYVTTTAAVTIDIIAAGA